MSVATRWALFLAAFAVSCRSNGEAYTSGPNRDEARVESVRVAKTARSLVRWAVARHDRGDRVAAARRAVESKLRDSFASVGAAYPPKHLFLRAFKREGELEMWAPRAHSTRDATQSANYVRVATYAICASSGKLGP